MLPGVVSTRNHTIRAAWTPQPSSALHQPLTLSQPAPPPQPPLTFSRQSELIKHARHVLSPRVRGCRTQPALRNVDLSCFALPGLRPGVTPWDGGLWPQRQSRLAQKLCCIYSLFFSLNFKSKIINLILQSLLMFTLFIMLSLFSKHKFLKLVSKLVF